MTTTPTRKKKTPEEQSEEVRDAYQEAADPKRVSPLRQEPPLDMGGITPAEGEVEEAKAHDQEAADVAYVEDQARRIFADDLLGASETAAGVRTVKTRDGRVADADTGEILAPEKRVWRPGPDVLIDVRGGGKYLTARRRLQWMRQEPRPHPEWGIKTELIEHERGTFKNKTGGGPRGSMAQIEGGFAIFKAIILNESGRVIAEASATEWSEMFPDYIEKAETAAVARALAVAGFGTEQALDFDEGWEAGNIADAPVRPDVNAMTAPQGPPINITASDVAGVRQGGRQSKATPAQLQAIRSFARTLAIPPTGLQAVIKASLPARQDPVFDNDLDDSGDSANLILGFLSGLSFDECGLIVQVLEAAEAGTSP